MAMLQRISPGGESLATASGQPACQLEPQCPLLSSLGVARVDLGFLGGSVGKESACNAGDPGLMPRSGRSPGGGHGNTLQYSCLENFMDRGV